MQLASIEHELIMEVCMTKLGYLHWVLLVAMLLIVQLSQASAIFPYKINKVVLDNGLTVLSIPYDSPGLVAYYTVVRAGSRNEVEPGHSGFAHFFEHMMFRGTEKYPAEKYNDVLKLLGADSNAFTTDDWTCYHIVASADALETIIDLESDRFIHLKYSEPDFKTEAAAILGEYNKNFSIPYMTMFEKLQDAAFTTHTYKHTTMGFLKDIEDMPNQYEYSLKFFDRFYRPENVTIIVVGDFNQDKLISLIKKYYGSWERGSYELSVPQEPPQTEEKIVQIPWKSKTLPYLLIGYHVPAFSDKDMDRPAIDVLGQLLFSESSHLYQSLVVEKQLVEFISGGAEDHRDPFLFTILTRIKDPKNIELVRDEIYKALDEAKAKTVDLKRLEDVKSHMKYSFAMQLDRPDNIAVTVGNYVAMTGDPESMNRVYALYEKVTPEDILRVAQKYFGKENRTVVTLTYEENAK